MAKKFDVDIDPDKFLDSPRPEMPTPTAPGEGGTEGSVLEKAASAVEKPPAKTGEEEAKKEETYLERFFYALRVPMCSGKTAYICKNYHEWI